MTAAIKTAIGLVAVFICIGIVGVVVWIVGLKRAAVAIGKPTPEEARVEIDKTKKPVEAKGAADLKEIQDASNDELEAAAHAAARDRLPK